MSTPNHIHIATEFAHVLLKRLGQQTLIDIDKENARETNPDVCHSKDHTSLIYDFLFLAFKNSTGVEFNARNSSHLGLVKLAWDHCRTEGFQNCL